MKVNKKIREIHEMRLNDVPFELMKNGTKTIEYRLNDKKRQRLKLNDIIVFKRKSKESDKIKVKVLELKYYKNLLDMYSDNFDELKSRYKTPEEVVLDTNYYTEDEISEFGCVAIKFEKID